MKTPRELLLERHRQVQSKLDAIRREALAPVKDRRAPAPISLWDVMRSLRWHLAGMSAIWLFVLFLHLDTSPEQQMMATIPPAKTPPPQVIMVSVRENRRQLAEMMDAQPPANEHHEAVLPKPRSEWRGETLMA